MSQIHLETELSRMTICCWFDKAFEFGENLNTAITRQYIKMLQNNIKIHEKLHKSFFPILCTTL